MIKVKLSLTINLHIISLDFGQKKQQLNKIINKNNQLKCPASNELLNAKWKHAQSHFKHLVKHVQ